MRATKCRWDGPLQRQRLHNRRTVTLGLFDVLYDEDPNCFFGVC